MLIFCLVFLLVLTMMGVASMESTVLEERMAGNMQDHTLAFQAAEAGLQAGEEWLQGEIFWPSTSSDGSTAVWIRNALDPAGANAVPWWREASRDTSSWWESNATAAEGFTELADTPGYIIEEYATSRSGQSISIGSGATPRVRVFHRLTSRGTGATDSSVVQLQSTYVKVYE